MIDIGCHCGGRTVAMGTGVWRCTWCGHEGRNTGGKDMVVSNVKLVAAPRAQQELGMLGYVSFELDGMLGLDGVTLRKTRDGRLTLSYPARRDGRGVDHPLVRPLSHRAMKVIESQVLCSLGLENAHG